MSEIEIKVCPKCGSDDKEVMDFYSTGPIHSAVVCRKCGFRVFGRDKNNAITDWNFRSEITSLTARAEKAERELAEQNAFIERLIEAVEQGKSIPLLHEPEISSIQAWYGAINTLIAEWRKEREG